MQGNIVFSKLKDGKTDEAISVLFTNKEGNWWNSSLNPWSLYRKFNEVTEKLLEQNPQISAADNLLTEEDGNLFWHSEVSIRAKVTMASVFFSILSKNNKMDEKNICCLQVESETKAVLVNEYFLKQHWKSN
jgi:hypothetical protein